MRNNILLLFQMFVSMPGVALAASNTVTLEVQDMTCAVCPITVKKALEQVSGVQQVSIDYASKTVKVQFDDTVATTKKLTEATKAAGYPATVKEGGE
jgi:periplasmic mercuric ion binding protein